ncbi:CLUMA_CG007947, isoform A [Clunio marinus]|uniref:CLUMA_CG007947, isoform A n=1 Tax=Clunio marinus TaxID=568069 RepID=A0A1J1I2B1_9DIPT|nr:CLUMA_CG007947, isoform A [Clunio marinus]
MAEKITFSEYPKRNCLTFAKNKTKLTLNTKEIFLVPFDSIRLSQKIFDDGWKRKTNQKNGKSNENVRI